MEVLFEYYNEVSVNDPLSLRQFLAFVWTDQHTLFDDEFEGGEENETKLDYQPFLSFDGNLVRAKNFVGFIQTEDQTIEIYPKVFRQQQAKPILMLKHLFAWFEYCQKWKFPFTQARLDHIENISLPELIVFLMSSTIHGIVSTMPVSLYESVEEGLYSPKGKINFQRYLSAGFINGNQHRIECDHEPFVYDNKLNRAIKYTCRLLLSRTRVAENQNLLNEVVFLLDDVDDRPCTIHDLERVVLSPLFSEYNHIKNICKIVLQQLHHSNQKFELDQWALLFPMEYIFEDFVAGFLASKFADRWIVEFQKSNLTLTSDPPAFQMRHDIFLTSKRDKSQKIIVDTKYKLRDVKFKEDKKKGILQSDLYQMVSYAMRRGCSNVLLLYPNIEETIKESDTFLIKPGNNDSFSISIEAAEIPFWSILNFKDLELNLYKVLSALLDRYENL